VYSDVMSGQVLDRWCSTRVDARGTSSDAFVVARATDPGVSLRY
jgi:hypothetical protein